MPSKLSGICKRKVSGFMKAALNAILAEHEFPEQFQVWANERSFASTTTVCNISEITRFSKPKYNSKTLSYIFSFLDVHYLITNCRIKVCKDEFPQHQITKQAWLAVANENTTGFKIVLVENLLYKQSDSIAKETFSKDVEMAMF